jgi:tetratricopeptide (TPR) repeat protein
MLAFVYALLGRREDTLRLADRAEHEDADGFGGRSTLAPAFEYIDLPERADACLSRLPGLQRDFCSVRVADIAIDAGRLARGEVLAAVIGGECSTLVNLRLHLARAYARHGDPARAHVWLDRAFDLMSKPKYFQPNLMVALAAADLGETERAAKVADAVDRATYEKSAPYGAPEHIDLAHVYAAVGQQQKVEQILAGFASIHARNIASGFASAARAYAELGRMEEARKLATRAEGKLGRRDSLGHLVLARTYLLLGDFARAIDHARKITDYMRVDALVEIARAAHGRSIEETPEIAAELAKL